MEIYKSIYRIITPLIAISLLVGVILIFIGGNGKSEVTKKVGFMFVISDIAALLRFFAMLYAKI